MVGGGSLVFVLLFTELGYSGAGPLAAIIAPFIAALCWKWQGWSSTYVSLSIIYFNKFCTHKFIRGYSRWSGYSDPSI